MLVKGAGGISVSVEARYDGQPEIRIKRWAWDRMCWDPHAAESEYNDAGYYGGVLWKDYDDALTMELAQLVTAPAEQLYEADVVVSYAKAFAVMDGRDFIAPHDVKQAVLPVLRHRVALAPELMISGQNVDQVLSSILQTVEAPRQ